MNESELEIAQRAVAAAGADADALVLSERSGLARFAGSEVHQPTLIENVVVRVRVVLDDSKVGVAVTNRTGDDALRELGQRAREAAASAPPDPHFPGLAQPEEVPDAGGWDEETASLGADEQAERAGAVLTRAGEFGLYGFFTSAETAVAVASSTGVAAHERLTDACVVALASTDDRSGWASATSWRARDLDVGAVADEAVAKARRTEGATDLVPGRYRAVLEPHALAEMLFWFCADAFGGLALVEERSFVSGRLGDRVFDETVTIADDPLDPHGLPKGFDAEGVPKRRVPLVEQGIARGAVWDRDAAARAAAEQGSTGAALPESMQYGGGAYPTALSMAGGDAESLDELAEAVGDGIYVTRVHYLGLADPRAGILTGMTRDGTFRIRGGKVAEPLVNLRFTVAMPDVLADVPALSKQTALCNQQDFYGERYPIAARVPAIATGAFNITGVGSRPGL